MKQQNATSKSTNALVPDSKPDPSISVLLIHNSAKRAEYLDEAISSVKYQTYCGPIAIVLIYNGNSNAYYDKLCEKYVDEPNTQIVRVKNSHIGAARNAGILHTRSDWFAFLDDDDWLTKGYIEELSYGISNTVNLVLGRRFDYKSGAIKRSAPLNKIIDEFDDMVLSERITNEFLFSNLTGRLFRTSYFISSFLPIRENLVVAEDVLFWVDNIELLGSTFTVSGKNKKEAYIRRVSENSLSRQRSNANAYARASRVVNELVAILIETSNENQSELIKKLLIHQFRIVFTNIATSKSSAIAQTMRAVYKVLTVLSTMPCNKATIELVDKLLYNQFSLASDYCKSGSDATAGVSTEENIRFVSGIVIRLVRIFEKTDERKQSLPIQRYLLLQISLMVSLIKSKALISNPPYMFNMLGIISMITSRLTLDCLSLGGQAQVEFIRKVLSSQHSLIFGFCEDNLTYSDAPSTEDKIRIVNRVILDLAKALKRTDGIAQASLILEFLTYYINLTKRIGLESVAISDSSTVVETMRMADMVLTVLSMTPCGKATVELVDRLLTLENDSLVTILNMGAYNSSNYIVNKVIKRLNSTNYIRVFSLNDLQVQDALSVSHPVRIWYDGVKIDPDFHSKPIKLIINKSSQNIKLVVFDAPDRLPPYYRIESDVADVKQLRLEIHTIATEFGSFVMYFCGYDKLNQQIQTLINIEKIQKCKTQKVVFKVPVNDNTIFCNFICWFEFEAETEVTVETIKLFKYQQKSIIASTAR